MSSSVTYINTGVSNESVPSISESPIAPKHRVDKPLIIVTTTDIPAQETKKEEVSDKGCAKVCRYILIRSKKVFEILTYFRLVVAIALNILIIIDLISIRQKKVKLFWMEVLTQVSWLKKVMIYNILQYIYYEIKCRLLMPNLLC
jgi:hypothetical protein